MRTRARAFTLVELLVVLAIVGILMGCYFQLFTQRERRRGVHNALRGCDSLDWPCTPIMMFNEPSRQVLGTGGAGMRKSCPRWS